MQPFESTKEKRNERSGACDKENSEEEAKQKEMAREIKGMRPKKKLQNCEMLKSTLRDISSIRELVDKERAWLSDRATSGALRVSVLHCDLGRGKWVNTD